MCFDFISNCKKNDQNPSQSVKLRPFLGRDNPDPSMRVFMPVAKNILSYVFIGRQFGGSGEDALETI
jgi:hypothetical protein